ncbi:oxidoreductase [Liquorilactobacillus satsumensis]|uniref:oxidoreductase n=1 Tax=Lactobacillaceae TaxID=33958 RepID=UPI0021C3F52E|nr:oxidoreductase [Liquorilactobacillus satsumensis]MCP9313710.1 oxidoreductase [Liquorilactobacillus satsumensis]MCP9360851.1 oxidoreductase [Liquorilactobacillus satsumensis]
MNTNSIAELVVSLAVVAIPVLGAYVAKFLKSNKVAATLISVLTPLAKDAVIAVEKLGVTQYLEGELKKSKAVEYVVDALEKLGFTKADKDTIANAIETQYAALSQDGTLDQYKQMTEAQSTEATKKEALEKAQTALANANQTVVEAQKKVNELQGTAAATAEASK